MKIQDGTEYFFSEALKSIRRNGFLSIATVSTVTISIFILGVALLLVLNATDYMTQLEEDVEIVAFVDREYDEVQVTEIGQKIAELSGIKELIFVPKEEAMASMQEKYQGEGYDLEATVGTNPLPNSYRVKAVDPHQVSELAQQLQNIEGVYKVNYGQGIVDKIFLVTQGVRWFGAGAIGFLMMGAVFLIGINIRLAIFARRKEIYLMKLIGAKDSFISKPFYIEGVLLGILGAVIAVAALAVSYTTLLNKWHSMVYFLPLVNDISILMRYYVALLVGGIVLGLIGTCISIRRFMDV